MFRIFNDKYIYDSNKSGLEFSIYQLADTKGELLDSFIIVDNIRQDLRVGTHVVKIAPCKGPLTLDYLEINESFIEEITNNYVIGVVEERIANIKNYKDMDSLVGFILTLGLDKHTEKELINATRNKYNSIFR